MFEIKDTTEPRLTLINEADDAEYEVDNFYGRNDYGQDGKLGIHHDELPEEFEDLSAVDFQGWLVVATEVTDNFTGDTETKWGIITKAVYKADGWFFEYEKK